jgi:hypothetical protein
MKECLNEEILQQYFDGELEQVHLERAIVHLAGCETCTAKLTELENETNLVATALAPEFEVLVPTQHLRTRIDAAISGLQVVKPVKLNAGAPVGKDWFAGLLALLSFSPRRTFAYGGLAAVVTFAAIFGLIQWQRVSPPQKPDERLLAKEKDKSSPGIEAPPINKPSQEISQPKNPPTERISPTRKNRPITPQSEPNRQAVAAVKLLPGERSYLKTIAALDSTIKSGKSSMRPALQAEYERNLALVDRAIAATRSAAKRNPNDPDAADFMFAAYQSKVDLLNTVADARAYNQPR